MKSIIKFIPVSLLAAGMVSLYSCAKEDIEVYSGQDGIYFDQHWGVSHFGNDIINRDPYGTNLRQTYSRVPFGEITERDSTLKINIQVSGHVRDYDRPFGIQVVADSTSAIEGEEFEIPEKDLVIKAGQIRTTLRVVCHRTERMLDETVKLQVRILPGEHFAETFGPTGVGVMPIVSNGELKEDYPNNLDAMVHNIYINSELVEPVNWYRGKTTLGVWSKEKYSILLRLTEEQLGWTVLHWSATNDMANGAYKGIVSMMWPAGTGYITGANLLAKYIREQFDKGREYWLVDPDGTMMWVKNPLITWAEDTKPEDIE